MHSPPLCHSEMEVLTRSDPTSLAPFKLHCLSEVAQVPHTTVAQSSSSHTGQMERRNQYATEMPVSSLTSSHQNAALGINAKLAFYKCGY